MRLTALAAAIPFAAACALAHAQTDSLAPSENPERDALLFLTREVPLWFAKNNCYSCHNNGDGARALFVATRFDLPVDRAALADTTKWLTQPQRWKRNGGEGEFNDQQLAAIQFASALLEATRAGLVKERRPLVQAAEIVAAFQRQDGSWTIAGQTNVGSPATYGKFLATAASGKILLAADSRRFHERIAKAESWLLAQRPQTVLDAATTLRGLSRCKNPKTGAQRQDCLQVIRQGETKAGGWGPFVSSAAEPFDTALVLLALSELQDSAENREMMQRGRRYLIDSQLVDGGWQETTRPAGAESYAQRISTTGWAAMALLATQARAGGAAQKKSAPR